MRRLKYLLQTGLPLLFILCALAHTAFAEEAQRGPDWSLNILSIVVGSLGVMVTVLALIIVSVSAFGFFEIRSWKENREKIEKNTKEMEDKVKQIEKYAKEAEDFRNKARENLDEMSKDKDIEKIPQLPLPEEPTKEVKEIFDEFSRKFECLEMFGIPLKPEDYLYRGVDLHFKGRYGEELKAYDKAIELKPDYADALFQRGLALGIRFRYEEAHKDFEKVLELKPDDFKAWYNKGLALIGLGRYEEALEAFEKAIGLKPDYADAWWGKGLALYNLGRHDEALNAYDKAIELKPDYVEARYNRACVYAIKGEKEKALSDLKKAIELDASNRGKAKKDEDFKNLWDDEDFKKLVE